MRIPAFPRSYERGSIEATPFDSLHVSAGDRFHVRMNVAQLKRSDSSDSERRLRWFPRSYERGSIEAISMCLMARRAGIGMFPRSYERGSIEALCCADIRTC